MCLQDTEHKLYLFLLLYADEHIAFNTTICFNSTSGTAPQYLSDLLQPYTLARHIRSASDTGTFVTRRVNTKTFGERSFSYAGPSIWNNLPQTLRHSDSTSFKAALNTHLFNNYF